eukprot:m.460018 g.460018  ORF g.460018 m.460018 type:complete len:301 (-) comp21906_c0_seq1:345-1247(-)
MISSRRGSVPPTTAICRAPRKELGCSVGEGHRNSSVCCRCRGGSVVAIVIPRHHLDLGGAPGGRGDALLAQLEQAGRSGHLVGPRSLVGLERVLELRRELARLDVRNLHALEELIRGERRTAELVDCADLAVDVEREGEGPHSDRLLFEPRVHHRGLARRPEQAERDAERPVVHGEWVGHVGLQRVDRHLAPNDIDVRFAEVQQRAQRCEGDGVDQVAAVVKHGDVHPDGPHLFARDNAQRLCFHRPALLERPLHNPLNLHPLQRLPAHLERRRRHWRELDAVPDQPFGRAVCRRLHHLA